MTIEEQRKAIIEDAKEAGFEIENGSVFAVDGYSILDEKLAKFAQLQAARNQSNNVPVAMQAGVLRINEHGEYDYSLPWGVDSEEAFKNFVNIVGFGEHKLYTSPQQSNALEMAAKLAEEVRLMPESEWRRKYGAVTAGGAIVQAIKDLIPQPESTAPQQEIPNEMQEIANFKKWFQSVQGIEYQGMYTFAYDAWMARAKSAAQPESDGK
jgi:hypothetical protein